MPAGTPLAVASPLTTPASPAAWRERARRLAVPAGAVLALAVIAVALGGPARTFVDALERAAQADPRWVVAGIAFEACSFVGYVLLLWHVAGRDAPRIGVRESYQLTLAGAAATRLLPTAGMGGAAVTLWGLRRAGHRGRAGVRTLLTFLVVLYSVFLGAILVVGGLAAAGVLTATGPVELSAVPAALAGVAILVALGLSRRPAAAGSEPAAGWLGRARMAGAVLGEAVGDARALVRRGDPRLLGAVAWWGFDVCVLWAAFNAAGSPPPLAVLVLGYFVGQVANTVPVPGAASSGMIGVLIAFGVDPALTLASVVAYRGIAIWIPAPLGATAAAGLRRTVARWAAEDEPAAGAPEERAAVPPPPRGAERVREAGEPPRPPRRAAPCGAPAAVAA